MTRFNNCEHRIRAQNYKLALISIGFLIIFQDIHVIISEATPQNGRSGSLLGFFQPLPLVSNIIQGAEKTVENLIPGPLRAQQTPTTVTTPTTKTTQTPTTKTTTTQESSLFQFLQPPTIVSNIIQGAEDTVRNLIPGPLRAQQTSTTTKTSTTQTTTPPPATTNESNPLQSFWNIFQPKMTPTTTSSAITPTTTEKPKSSSIFAGVSNIISDVINPFNIFKSPDKSKATPVTTEAPNPIGSLFNGIGGLLGLAPTTTTTTLYPPPRGGRGFSGVVYNIINIISDFLDILNDVLLINDDWVPGYVGLKLADMYESIEAELDIFLQYDQPGGLGEIWKSLSGIWNDLSEIFKTATSGNLGGMIGLPIVAAKTVQDIGKLNGEFALNFPSTTFAPGIKHQPSESVKLNDKELQNVLNHTESLVENVLRIEEVVQKEFPNSKILQILGYIRESFIKALNDSKKTGKPIIMDTIETMFPNDVLDTYIADFGKFLNEYLPNFAPIQTAGNLLQQKFIVNIGLSIVEAFTNPFFENIEKFIEKFIENIVSRYLVLDPDHFLVNLIDTLNNRAVDYGNYLNVSENVLNKLKLNFTEGDLFRQLRNNILDITTSNITYDFVRQTVGNFLGLIPLDFGEDIIHGITSIITDGIVMFMRFLSRTLETVFPQSPIATLNLNITTTLKPNGTTTVVEE